MTESRIGKVETTLGLIDPSQLGITHMHEHVIINYLDFYKEPTQEELQSASVCCGHTTTTTTATRQLHKEKISLDNVHWVQYNYDKNLHNLELNELDIAAKELQLFKQCGGQTIVEVTTQGIGRDPILLKKIASDTNLNIIMGAGYYVDKTIRNIVLDMEIKEMEEEIIKQVLVGVDGSGIKCGIIGEVGCSWPLTESEIKSLKASAGAQKKTGVSISIHPGRSLQAPLEILRILKEAGADLSRVIMGHIDRTIHHFEMLESIAKTGCCLEYDLFGMEISYYPWGGDVMGMPSDNQRIEWISRLINQE
ncbi:phosphotriesterase-related protein [Cavenderia fasciculata]|uniref:Phosphotriesterase-related protein n=1 Tax=Cavenderia fasciculata TaxID=261658 RepID=F4Q7R0_CACFS|nr:phosphotriesterase-related protein [Cavenderia fasciculata]EGG15810.1 phosphotriesterase-related protein [Cavenderia fasciculata]|eukprot:XP_004352135.1 phosphotriesterase-related protein [Cavenderia fasciculata]